MSVSKKDLMLLTGFAGVLAAVLVFFFLYRPLTDKAEVLKTENEALTTRIAELEKLEAEKELYVAKTDEMSREISKTYELFPSNVMTEDVIYFAIYEEATAPLKVSGITIEPQVLQYQMGANTQEAATTDDAAAEGTEAEAEASVPADVASVSGNNAALYNQAATLSYEVSYAGLKRCIDYVCKNPNRMTVDNVMASYDNTTGLLTGNMKVNMYFLTGNGKPYTPPNISNVLLGNSNLFGSIVIPSEAQQAEAENAQ